MKILVLTQKSAVSYYIINHLPEEHECHVLCEGSGSFELLIRKIKYRFRKFGVLKGLIEIAIMLIELPFILKENRKVSEYLTQRLKDQHFRKNITEYTIKSVNSKQTVQIANELKPALILVLGTRIIDKTTIEGLNKVTTNIFNWHSGITPLYRGVQSEFYCILNNEVEMAGSTLHYLDTGIDSGKPVMQRTIQLSEVEKNEKNNYLFLKYKNVLLFKEMITAFIQSLEKGQVLKEEIKTSGSKLYSTPTVKDYKRYYSGIK
ncbi:MAG: Bifunctional polymyxin resistance protein ArnA [Bacteroidia bacterium]|nr:Bifunctional polymyxin resistance protein ArnA [Bacteroidia bacterium]